MAHILIADDDADYRAAFCSGLGALGHEVESVESGDQVEAAVTTHTPSYDIVFLDVMMPAGGAASLLERISAIRPDLPVLLITGRSDITESPLFRHVTRRARARVHKTASLQEIDMLVRSLTAA